jgi:DNA-binding NtrC family response regulator
MPRLGDRGEDIQLLADYFLGQLNERQGTSKVWTEDSLDRLRTHSWPGNVRELKNVVHRAFIMADHEITPRCLPREVGGDSGSIRSLNFQVGSSIEDVERRLIMATLDAYAGNKRKTADILGVSLKTLYNRLNTYRVE